MKLLIIAARLLIMICYMQFALSMEQQLNQPEKPFISFLMLPQDLLNNIFDMSDNKTNMQHINREWNQKKSIRSSDIFQYVRLTTKQLNCILLNAAYLQNYAGVDNILKNTDILANKLPFYSMGVCDNGNGAALDLWGIAEQNNDKNLCKILRTYNIPFIHLPEVKCLSNSLHMMCFAGNTSNLKEKFFAVKNSTIGLGKDDIEYLLNIIVDYDRIQCFNILCANQDIYQYIKGVINKKLLYRACTRKSKNVLKGLLRIEKIDTEAAKALNLNYKPYWGGETLLDEFLRIRQRNSSFGEIATILQENGAMTSEEIKMQQWNTKEWIQPLQFHQPIILQVPLKQNWWNSLFKTTYDLVVCSVMFAAYFTFISKRT